MNLTCEFCRRDRNNQNDTNWKRHIESCQKKIKDKKLIWMDFLKKQIKSLPVSILQLNKNFKFSVNSCTLLP